MACDRGQGAAPPAAPPPVPVQMKTLSPTSVPDATEYVATLKSLGSTSVRPQVEGIITRIFVKSGVRVRAGAPIVQIDAARQQAAVSSQAAARAAREAELGLARTELERAKSLFAGGAISKAELDQAETRVKTLEAELASLSAQLREGRVQLQYFQVLAPTAGIVGDVPVRVGNRVTPETELTTIDENRSLEVHVSVSLERAPDLRPGVPIEVLDREGETVARTTVSFIAPRVEEDTQSVLAKGLIELPAGRQEAVGARLRSLQYVRARVIWRETETLLVPVVAVVRINGQPFVYVAEDQGGSLVARQRSIRVGPIVRDDYTVVGGLKPNERVVTSGALRLVDGAPITPQTTKPPSPQTD
jgi:RND family efflux transporter MFP subunit